MLAALFRVPGSLKLSVLGLAGSFFSLHSRNDVHARE